MIESFVSSEDRAASQVPIAPSHTDLGVAQMGAFDAQAHILAQHQKNAKEIESVTIDWPPADGDARTTRTNDAEALLCATRTPESEIEKQIRQYWDDRGDEGVNVLQETVHLQTLLFRKKKSIQPGGGN